MLIMAAMPSFRHGLPESSAMEGNLSVRTLFLERSMNLNALHFRKIHLQATYFLSQMPERNSGPCGEITFNNNSEDDDTTKKTPGAALSSG